MRNGENHEEGGWAVDEYGLATGDLGWNMVANLRWLAKQSSRPPRVPCGMLTGAFLSLVADRFEELAKPKN